MGFFDSLVRALTGGPAHDPAFYRQMQHIAGRLDRPLMWSDECANMCCLGMYVGAQLYTMVLVLDGNTIDLSVRSKIAFAHGVPGEIEVALDERSQELPWGDWQAGEEKCAVVSVMSVRDLTPAGVLHALQTLAAEAAHFDQIMYRHGYA